MGTNFIVVPESLAADEAGRPLGKPSFAYRRVLDYTAGVAGHGDRVYLAPANSFGSPVTEESAAYEYLIQQQHPFELLCPGINLPVLTDRSGYVDSWGNAVLLKSIIDVDGKEFELVTTYLHAPRAQWCFARAGFRLTRVHPVRYTVDAGFVPRRNFYYRYPLLHRLYEALALVRDKLKYGWRRTANAD